jgi:diguanylate cyclase (GGDEF)-like protein
MNDSPTSATVRPQASLAAGPAGIHNDSVRAGHQTQAAGPGLARTAILCPADGLRQGFLRRLVRKLGVWRGVGLFTVASTIIAFLITGTAMHLADLDHRLIGYSIALACSLTIMPAIMASLLSLIERLETAEHRLYHLARTDELTALPNRRALFEAAGARAASDEPISLLFIDIDHFKRVNDTYGHQTGDEILRQVTRAIVGRLRETDLLCRYGGEEFAALLADTGEHTSSRLAEDLRRHMERTPIELAGEDRPLHVTISIGVSSAARADRAGIYQLIDQADRALYTAKHKGRNRVQAA